MITKFEEKTIFQSICDRFFKCTFEPISNRKGYCRIGSICVHMKTNQFVTIITVPEITDEREKKMKNTKSLSLYSLARKCVRGS